MSVHFDAYHKWLGIPPKDQPPHHYRLLGLELFEDDADVIDAAANRVMAYLHEIASGDATGVSQRLLNEISAARICLLNKGRKAAYDATLRDVVHRPRVATQSPAVRTPLRQDTIPAAGPPLAQDHPAPESISRSRRGLWITALSGVVTLAALGTTLLVWYHSQTSPPEELSLPPIAAIGQDAPSGNTAILIVDWPQTEREDGTLEVNGVPHALPSSEMIEVPIRGGPLQLHLTRSGYVEILWECLVARGEQIHYSPVWEPREEATSPAAPTASRPAFPAGSAAAVAQLHPAHSAPIGSTAASASTTTALTTFPQALAIPPLSSDAAGNWMELLTTAPNTDLGLRLVGGETSDIGHVATAFQLTACPLPDARQGWTVQVVDRHQQRSRVAELMASSDSLRFRWQPADPVPQAALWRHCLLESATGTSRVT